MHLHVGFQSIRVEKHLMLALQQYPVSHSGSLGGDQVVRVPYHRHNDGTTAARAISCVRLWSMNTACALANGRMFQFVRHQLEKLSCLPSPPPLPCIVT